MTVKLTPEQEQIVNEELKSGHYRSAEEVIAQALHVLRERGQLSSADVDDRKCREAVREMLSFVEKNRIRLEDVSIKELIHEGHRL